MEKSLRIGLLCLALTLLSPLAFAQQGSTITGTLLYNYSFPMNNVTADLYNSQGSLVATSTTNAAGVYVFNGIPDGTYSVAFSSNAQPGGVNLTDAFLVMLRLFNIVSFTPFQNMLADVNSSGNVTWADYFEIMISYLNQGNPFSGGNWDFEPLSITVSGGNRTGVTSAGASNGDVNGTFQPPKFGNCILDQIASNTITTTSEHTMLGLTSEDALEVAGMHLVFEVPEGIRVESVHTVFPDAHINQNGNEIRITWMRSGDENLALQPNKSFVEFTVSALESASSEEIYQLSLGSESHFIGPDGDMVPFVNLSLPGLKYETNSLNLTGKIYPNPFFSSLTLEYELPADGEVRVVVSNAAGQVIQVSTEYQAAGSHMLKIDGTNWSTGLYHYTLILSGEKPATVSGTMIKSR